MSVRHHIRALLLVGMALLTLLASTPGPAVSEETEVLPARYNKLPGAKYRPVVAPDTFGVNIDGLWNLSWTWTPTERKAHFDAIAASGITTVRASVVWEEVEKCRPGPTCPWGINWSRHDDWVAAAARSGLRTDLMLGWSALWATSVEGSEFAPPADFADFARFSADVARRYGAGGRFWQERPELPYRPVSTFEVWNEQNMEWWWRPGPDPAGYAGLYLATRAAVKAVVPSARVIVGGIATAPWTDWRQYKDTDYVRQMFLARPELKANIDGLGYHPYGASPEAVLDQVRAMRAVLREVGAGSVPLHLTELGWASDGWTDKRMDEATRAEAMARTLDVLVRSNCGVRQVAPYTWVSSEVNPASELDWMGIANRNGTPKPTGVAVAKLARQMQGYGPAAPNTNVAKVC